MIKQLTIRGFDPELERRLRAESRRNGVSLSKAALQLMRRGAGLKGSGAEPDVIGDALDQFIGTMSAEEEREILEAVEAFEVVDEEMWK